MIFDLYKYHTNNMKIDIEKKKVIIYGIGKVQRDFEYIFSNIEIIGYLVDIKYNDCIYNKGIYLFNDLNTLVYDYVIICDYDKEDKYIKLERYGLTYLQDFILADDLFESLDFPLTEKISNRKVIIWGTGKSSQKCMDYDIYCYMDNDKNKKGQYINGIEIKHPEDIQTNEWVNYYIIIASIYYFDIVEQLEKYGLHENEDFVWYKIIQDKPSELLKETMYDKSKYHLKCDTMFHSYEIEQNGQASCCCTTFISKRIGNLINQNFDDIWFSNIHKILCLSTENKTFTFCGKDMCPLLMHKEKLEQENNEEIYYQKLINKPTSLHISIDSSCNLFCSTCRKCRKVESGAELKRTELMADKLIEQNVPYVDFLSIAGDGEVFLSKVYERIWSSPESGNVKTIRILSNGTLFNKGKWEKLTSGKNSDIYLSISIDAANKETYENIRRGGNFSVLLENLKYASELRKENRIKYLQLNFVVQRENYREIIDFVKLGQSLNVDKVFFSKILNWGTYTEEEFENISMMEKDYKPKKELYDILCNPIFKERLVDLGTINWEHNKGEYDYVESFYEWEINEWINK